MTRVCSTRTSFNEDARLPAEYGIPTSPVRSNSQKAHQRLIREHHALEPDPLIEEKRRLAASLTNATVREITHARAKEIVLRYEWLGNMGVTDHAFGLYFGEYLAGVVCFGRTAGTKTAESICGKSYAHLVKVLNRGACVHWAHPHSASFLISHACRLMVQKGYHIFVAYSDPAAGEIGTVYQACGWHYCGANTHSSGFLWAGKPIPHDPVWGTFKDGKIHDERNIQHSVRCRRFANRKTAAYRIKCSRRERLLQMIDEGFLFVQTHGKGRYVNFYGDRETVTTLRAALRWNVLPYPKRVSEQQMSNNQPPAAHAMCGQEPQFSRGDDNNPELLENPIKPRGSQETDYLSHK